MIRKSATLTDVFFSVILVFLLFIGMYLWFSYNVSDSGLSVDSKYGSTYTEVLKQQSDLNKTVDTIKKGIDSAVEPESVYQTAMNGLKGLLALLTAPLQILSVAGSTYFAIGNLVEVPSWVKIITMISITTIIVLIIVAILKGEQKV